MAKPVFRRKSIGTKVSEEEYVRLEALAGGRAISEWVREVLLRELDGGQARPAVVTAKYSKISGPLSCSSNANEPSEPGTLVKLRSMSS